MRSDGRIDCWSWTEELRRTARQWDDSHLFQSGPPARPVDLAHVPSWGDPFNTSMLCVLMDNHEVACSGIDPEDDFFYYPLEGYELRTISAGAPGIAGITTDGRIAAAFCLPEGGDSRQCNPATGEEEASPDSWVQVHAGFQADYLVSLDGVGTASTIQPFPGVWSNVVGHANYDLCGIHLDGSLGCVGRGGRWDDPPPEDVTPVPDGRYIAIDSTHGLACALSEDMELVCWGEYIDWGPIVPCTVPRP